MRLSEAGELGLLRELESRGLIVDTEHDAAELGDGLVVTQDALVEEVHFTLDQVMLQNRLNLGSKDQDPMHIGIEQRCNADMIASQ